MEFGWLFVDCTVSVAAGRSVVMVTESMAGALAPPVTSDAGALAPRCLDAASASN